MLLALLRMSLGRTAAFCEVSRKREKKGASGELADPTLRSSSSGCLDLCYTKLDLETALLIHLHASKTWRESASSHREVMTGVLHCGGSDLLSS